MYTIIIQIPKVLSNNELRILVNSNQLTLIEKGKNLCPVSSLLQISDAMLSNPLEKWKLKTTIKRLIQEILTPRIGWLSSKYKGFFKKSKKNLLTQVNKAQEEIIWENDMC